MNASTTAIGLDHGLCHRAIAAVVDSIAPSWPLDRMIAVNPYRGSIHQTFEETAETLAMYEAFLGGGC